MNKILIGLVAISGAALAQVVLPAEIQLKQYLVKTDGDKELLIAEPKTVLPGQTLEQQISVTNTSPDPMKSSFVRLPTPKGATFIKVVKGTEPEYSLDGKTFSQHPMKEVQVTVNGATTTQMVPAEPSDYKATRFKVIDLKPGAKMNFAVRFKVN